MGNLLFHHKYKKIGWFIFVPSILIGTILITNIGDLKFLSLEANVFSIFPVLFQENNYFSIIKIDIVPTLVGILIIIGGILVGFSKEKIEDEFIQHLRLTSLLWAVLANYLILLLCFIFIYGENFLEVMVYNIFTVLIIFIFRFNYILYKTSISE
jgi:hypothetical protein